MQNRFQQLFRLPQRLYLEDAPVIIEEGALLRDNVTSKILAQLKIHNISNATLTCCKVSLKAYEPNGNEVEGVSSFAYLDIKASCNEMFGVKTPIVLPDNLTRSFTVSVIEAVFKDGTVWQHEPTEWKPVPKRIRVEQWFHDKELEKQYQIELGGTDAQYIPQTKFGLFQCVCGTENQLGNEHCIKCNRTPDTVKKALDIPALTEKKNVRLKEEEEQKKAEEERLEKERLEAERKKKIKHRNKVIGITAGSCAAILLLVGTLGGRAYLREKNYQSAVEKMEQGEYTEASELLKDLGDYKDAQERVRTIAYTESRGNSTIAAGLIAPYTVAVKSDGTVVATGYNEDGECNVSDWTDIVAISAGEYHTVGLRSDGTVVATGDNENGQCDVSDWTDIVAVSAGAVYTVGLKSDGTVDAVGLNSGGECDVSDWNNIVAISAGGAHTVGLKSDGTVVAVGNNSKGQCDVSDWSDIIAISASLSSTVGLKSDGTVVAAGEVVDVEVKEDGQCDISSWTDIVAISAGPTHTIGLKSDGTTVTTSEYDDGYRDMDDWHDIVAIAAGSILNVGLKSDGTLVVEDIGEEQADLFGELSVSDWKDIKMPSNS